jgi:translocation and assembly module TamA
VRRQQAGWRAAAAGALLCALLGGLLPTVALAGIRIVVSGVDPELERNIMVTLSMARYADRTRMETDAVERLFRRVDAEVADAVRPFGYYHPVVKSSLETLEKPGEWRVQIDVTPGAPMLIDSVAVAVHGAGGSDAVFAPLIRNIPMREGERLQHRVYDDYKSQLEITAITYGYFDARWERAELRTDAVADRAAIGLELVTGERYHFGATSIEQKSVREERVRRFLQYQQGEPYNDVKRLRTQFALDDSLYFSSVTVGTGARDPATLTVPVEITTTPARNSLTFAAGYGGDTGARGSVSWLNPRVNSLGHRLQVRLQPSELRQLFEARYDVPFGDLAREKMSLNFKAADTLVSDVNNAQVRTKERSLTPSVTRVLNRWQYVLSVAVTHTVTEDPLVGTQSDDLIVPGITYASVPEGYLGEALLSRALLIEVLGSHRLLDARTNFLRVDLQSEKLFDLTQKWHLLLRGEFGLTATREPELVPGQYRFFAGGDRSVRGFANGELSPLRVVAGTTTAERAGGKNLATGTVEFLRDLPRNLALAAFVDFGNAIDHFSDPLAYSAGLGVRWRLPGLTLGIDIGKALHAPGFDSLPGPRLHLNISQAL